MQSVTLKDCIAALERLRHAYCSQLDARVLEEVDEVIRELTRLSEHAEGDVELGKLSMRALQIIDLILSLVTNITDLMH